MGLDLNNIKMSYELIIGGLALGGLGVYGARYIVKQRRLAAAAQKIKENEEAGSKRANSFLLQSSFYSDLESLRKQLDGEIILPSDGEKYHACRRRAFNQSQRGFPAVIARVRNTVDVAKCVKFVASHRKDINVCVASGCHSSKCMMDNSFIIDLYYMNKAVLDKENLTVSVEGGAYLEEIDKILQPHNLGVPVGTYPQTGVGGLVLGGGYGYLARMLGFSVDNFLEAEIVLPSGEVMVCNDTKNSDLMWGLRGGSGNFGIVTKFTFRVHKLPTYCLSGLMAHLTPTLASAVTVATNYDKIVSELPAHLQGALVCPGGAPVSPSLWCYFGEENSPSKVPELQKAVKMGGWITIQNKVKANSYHQDLQRLTTPLISSGYLYHSLIQFGEIGKELPVEFWEQILTVTRAKLVPALEKAMILMFPMGGKMSSGDPDSSRTSLPRSIRRAKYFGIFEVYWRPEFGEDGRNAARDWVQSVTKIIKPHSNEALRYAAADSTLTDTLYKDQAGYGMDIYPKLRALKKKYDPTNLFKNNVNIAPAE